MRKFPSPAPPYVGPPAKYSTGSNRPIKRIVIHSAVMPCEPGRARQLAQMNRAGTGGGSWHYAVDPDETLQCSYDSVICWHAPPNTGSIGIEMADYPGPVPTDKPGTARWKALRRSWRWARPNQRKMLRRAARLVAELALAEDLPVKYLGAKKLRAGYWGITTHAAVSRAWGQSTHWDPGWWPRRRFMRLVRAHARRLRKAQQ